MFMSEEWRRTHRQHSTYGHLLDAPLCDTPKRCSSSTTSLPRSLELALARQQAVRSDLMLSCRADVLDN